jgi:beta-lactam-binding protein with PASTA domain
MTVEEHIAIPDLVDQGLQASPQPAAPIHQAVPHRVGPSQAPDLIGLEALEAHAIARDAELRLSVAVWETTIGPWGRVLDQQPSPGTHVRRGSRIRIVVSGRPFLPVPDVRELPLSTAIEQLCWLGFVPIAGSRQASRSVPAGHIIATRPAAGELAVPGTVVALAIAKADREVPSER